MPRYSFVQWFRPSVEQSLFVHHDLADHEWNAEASDGRFRVSIRFPHPGEQWGDEFRTGTLGREDDPFLAVRMLEVSVSFESQALDEDEEGRVAILKDAHRIGADVMLRFRSWLRLNQPWLGLADSPLERVGPSLLVDVDTGQRAPGYGEEHLVAIVNPPLVTETGLDTIQADVEPPISESLLADARFLGLWRQPRDLQRAVLTAAIACEVKVKLTLLDKSPLKAQALLDAILANPRAFPHAAVELFHPIAKAVVGRSLHEENSGLYKRLQRLFELRNGIAHRGDIPPEDQVIDAIGAAGETFTWLESL